MSKAVIFAAVSLDGEACPPIDPRIVEGRRVTHLVYDILR